MKRTISLFVSLMMCMQILLGAIPVFAEVETTTETYAAPDSPAVTYNMNLEWKYMRPSTSFPLADSIASAVKGGKNFYEVGYDDSDWETVSVPHAINALESFDGNAYDSGEAGVYRGFSFYRKNINIPATDAGKKFILEFEAVRQTVYLYVNGEMAGYYEAGVTAMGFDITSYLNVGEDNLIAVATDNTSGRGASVWVSETVPGSEPGSNGGAGYQWNTKDFNEIQGGITGNVNLYAKNKIYQTLPLYSNMKTTGNYVYATDIDPRAGSATINVKAEVRNESDADKNLTLQVDVVNSEGELVTSFSENENVPQATDKDAHFLTVVPDDAYAENPAPTSTETVDVTYITASAHTEGLEFWSPDAPFLYTVYCILKDGDTVIDVTDITTGFRKVTYDINDGGLKINDQPVWLTGYAQRATNEWAVVGVANDWLCDIDMQLVKESNANFIRWMHVAPKPNAIRSGDKYGVVSVCPAGDKESDATGRTWDQRVEVMRDAMIYFRNSPSILFWETGNNQVTPEHMKEMADLELVLDPETDRFSGSRTLSSQEQIREAEYVGTMLNRHASGAKASMAALNKYVPIMETEYAREEAPRRVWDDFSPPDYDYNNKWLGPGASKQDNYDVHDLTSEDFVVANVGGYNEFYRDKIGGASGNNYYSAAAALVWSDSNQHTRNSGSENCRTSGRVDPVRLKKQSFYAYQAMQATEPTINIIGHWNYPQLTDDTYWYPIKEKVGTAYEATGKMAQRDPKNKTVYVVGSADVKKIELYINDKLAGTCSTPTNTFLFAFPNIDVTQSGKVSAKAYNAREEVIAEDEIVTAGEAATVRLTPYTGPDGLIADGSDIMYFDVEVVDADGNVCPLNYDRISLEVNGEGVLLGGYNSGEGETVEGYGRNGINEIGQNFVYAECGINRVFVKSTRNAGTITLTASLEGKLPVSRTITSEDDLNMNGGLTTMAQRSFKQGEVQPIPVETVDSLKSLAQKFTAVWGENIETIYPSIIEKDVYNVTVNGTPVTFAEAAYRPDETTGVIAEITPVLDALNAAGANITYSINKDNKPSYTDGGLPIVKIDGGLKSGYTSVEAPNGSTTLFINGGNSETNLLNAEIALNSKDVLTADIAPLLGYIEGVETNLDVSNKVLNITYSNKSASIRGVLSSLFETTAYAEEETALYPSENGVVIDAAQALGEVNVIFATYDENGRLTGIEVQTVNVEEGAVEYVPTEGFSKSATTKAMVWYGIDAQSPVGNTVVVGEVTPDATPDVTPDVTDKPSGGGTPDVTDAPSMNYDSVLAYDDCENNSLGGTLEEGAPDGSHYIRTDESTYIDGVASIGADSMLDIIWEMDMKLGTTDGSGFSIRNKANNYGTCIVLNSGQFAIQTASTSFTKYSAVPADKWLHVELKGRYSALDAKIDMTVYYYNEDGSMTKVDTYENVNLRNLSAGNKAGAMDITINKDTCYDNVKVTLLGADKITITNSIESIKAGNTSLFDYGATRQGEYITSPAVTWEVYNADNTALLNDENITISESGLLNVGLNAASQTIYVRATAESGIYDAYKVNVEAVDVSDVKFDTITLNTEQLYVNADNPMTITATATKNGEKVELGDGDLIWYVTDENDLRKLGDELKLIKVENGVVTVDAKAVSQNITVRAADPTDVVRGSLPVYVKSSDALEGNDTGNLDKLLYSNACESDLSNAVLTSGSWDGTSYYYMSAGVDMAGVGGNTSTDLIFSMDIKFEQNGAGFIPKRADNGKLGSCLLSRENGGAYYLSLQTGSSSFTDLFRISRDSWYHITWIGKTGTYSSVILEEYDENGNRINRQVKAVSRRNDPPIDHVTISTGTCVDNVRALTPAPTAIELTTDVSTVLAGNTVQATASAYWNEVEMEGIDGSTVAFEIYDADNKYPLESDKITIDANGLITVDAMAPIGDVNVRVTSVTGGLYASKKLTILSSDVFEVTGIGIDSDVTKVAQLNVTKNFDTYDDEATFVMTVTGADGKVKTVSYTMCYADTLSAGANKLAVNMPLPEDYDKENDVINIYVVTKIKDIEGSEDNTVTVSSGTVTDLPEFNSADVVVLVLKAGTDVTSATADDIVYFNQYKASDIADGITIPGINTGDIVKVSGAVNGIMSIYTGIAE